MTEKSDLKARLVNAEAQAWQPRKLTEGSRPAALDEQTLLRLNHAEWLSDFSKVLALNTRVPASPGRQGMINRLAFAADYVLLLEKRIGLLEKRVKEYKEGLARTARDLELAHNILASSGLRAATGPPAPRRSAGPSDEGENHGSS